MAEQSTQRRLAAILAADVAGYSRLMNEDEEATITAWHSARNKVIDPTISEFSGRIVKHTGDGFLAEFITATEAVKCAIRMQEELRVLNQGAPTNRRMEFRMGINLSEITDDDEDIHGNGVNIAARLEGLAEPGGICITANVYDQVRKKIDRAFEDMGQQQVKNIAEPVSCYRVLYENSLRTAIKVQIGRPKRIIVRRIIVLTLAFAVAVVIWQSVSSPPPNVYEPPSLAILPFTTIGSDPSHQAFSVGLTEDIITALSSNRDIRVIAGAASARGEISDPRKRPLRSQARYVFEGNVRGDSKIRITAQLIDARTGFHLWGGRYDRQLTDTLDQQAEVSAKIVATLTNKLDRIQLDQAASGERQQISGFALVVLELIGRFAEETIALHGEFIAWLKS